MTVTRQFSQEARRENTLPLCVAEGVSSDFVNSLGNEGIQCSDRAVKHRPLPGGYGLFLCSSERWAVSVLQKSWESDSGQGLSELCGRPVLKVDLVYMENMSLVTSTVAAAENASSSPHRAPDDLDYMYVKVSVAFFLSHLVADISTTVLP